MKRTPTEISVALKDSAYSPYKSLCIIVLMGGRCSKNKVWGLTNLIELALASLYLDAGFSASPI